MTEKRFVIGDGYYLLSEAARYTGLPAATVRSWFKLRSDGEGRGPIFRSDFDPINGTYAVSFLNLIEVYVARFFRKEGVRPPIIRRAHEILQNELQTYHPFAHADLRTDGRRIILHGGDAELIDVISKQHFFGQMHLGRIKYGKLSRLAEAWGLAQGVSIDPSISNGKPVVERTGVATFVIANQYRANRCDAALVGKLFDLSPAEVMNAVRFEESLKRTAA